MCAIPRPIAPLSGSLIQPKMGASGSTVRFRFEVPSGVGATLQFCGDRTCATPIVEVGAPGGGPFLTGDVLVPLPSDAERRVLFWRLIGRTSDGSACAGSPSATWALFLVASTPSSAPGPGGLWGNVPDVNGDGLADLIAGDGDQRKIHLYFGLPTTTTGSTAPAQSIGAPSGLSSFPTKLGAAGDVNGDGIPDFFATGTSATGSVARLFLLHGRDLAGGGSIDPNPISDIPGTWIRASGLGDVNGDGYADVGALTADELQVYLGGPSGLRDSPATIPAASISNNPLTAASIAMAGDVNADGMADVLVGAPTVTASLGEVRVLYGGTGGLTAGPLLSGVNRSSGGMPPSGGNTFGVSVVGAGDVTGDGYMDIAVGQSGTSQIFIFPGGASGISSTSLTRQTSGTVGISIAAGDFNGDGLGDLATVNAGLTTVGYWLGGPMSETFRTLEAPSAGFGTMLVGLYDLSGDGLADLANGNGRGQVFVFSGSRSGLSSRLTAWIQPTVSAPRFGGTIAMLSLPSRTLSSRRPRAW